MHRRGRSLASLSHGLVSLSLVASLSAVGCGEEEFSDEAYGAIDLAPYFFDGSSAANPTAGLPREITGKRGWIGVEAGKRAEFYDFGLVNVTRKRSAAGATLAEPDTAAANPMYFFFDSNNRPLFSKPVFDRRTGTFHMRGGSDVLDPNPRTPPEGSAEAARTYTLPYSARARNTVVDPLRGSDDYQRPIIDKLHNDAKYAGVWEIIEVKVTDSGFVPDSIKSAKTLLAAKNAGKVTFRSTGKVINCPVLDDRTWVNPSPLAFQMKPTPFMAVRPRIEVWFRTKLGSCFLANGWETLGRTADEGGKLKDPRDFENVELTGYDNDGARLDTFDVIRFDVGNERNVVRTVVVPVGKHYIPKVTVPTLVAGGGGSDIRYVGDDLQTAQPRHFDYQPTGYSPLVWLHDITVPQDPPYTGGAFKTLEAADPTRIAARAGVFVKNFPVAGIASECRQDGDVDCADSPFGLTCNRFPDIDLATVNAPTGKNIADVMIEREGGPRCDVAKVGFGEYCAPGVSRCDTHVVADGDDAKALGGDKPKLSTTGPKFDMPAATDTVKTKYYNDNGYYKSYTNRGYACHPSTGGYCYVRCDGSATAGAQKDVGYKKDDGSAFDVDNKKDDVAQLAKKFMRTIETGNTSKQWLFNYDARCGGTGMLGYMCASSRPNAQRVCLRECTTRNTDAENQKICEWDFNDAESSPAGDGKFDFDVLFGAGQPVTGNLPGQTCNNLQGATSCSWNPDFEPRGDSSRWPQ